MIYIDPLENLDKFDIPVREPLYLPMVSVVVETRPEMFQRIRNITVWHRKFFRFQHEFVISTENPGIPGTQFIHCGHLPTPDKYLIWYSDLCVHGLANLCLAPYLLIWQWDGFIINPDRWTNSFLEWDYIGAPEVGFWQEAAAWYASIWKDWKNPYDVPGTMVVGNGGFSMRSKKFMDAANTLSRTGFAANAEDLYLCLERRQEMENMGIRFSPVELAKSFSVDGNAGDALSTLFGFHRAENFEAIKTMLEARYYRA